MLRAVCKSIEGGGGEPRGGGDEHGDDGEVHISPMTRSNVLRPAPVPHTSPPASARGCKPPAETDASTREHLSKRMRTHAAVFPPAPAVSVFSPPTHDADYEKAHLQHPPPQRRAYVEAQAQAAARAEARRALRGWALVGG
ncbi:hypothetical protein HYPSUDRAFT_954938 [Hypholoma sublateritium FD-334 SS-4]|uniref:Uncharacterized protein n=1 Tax=Hypholoma sublateritium (strain FD-334 SS-4) TaxID=945553 RepID=A0A0D2NNY6_HYPSF|nr:hypothetical protein HYPSUDRAFT_954938 [Hypholoma sublateritium FD-334 SS-4]